MELTRGLAIAQKRQTSLNVLISRVEFGGALIGVEGIGGLVVARLILHSKVSKNPSRVDAAGIPVVDLPESLDRTKLPIYMGSV